MLAKVKVFREALLGRVYHSTFGSSREEEQVLLMLSDGSQDGYCRQAQEISSLCADKVLKGSVLQALGRSGEAPEQCIPEVMRDIVQQHMDSPAMWAIFPLQVLTPLHPPRLCIVCHLLCNIPYWCTTSGGANLISLLANSHQHKASMLV